MKQRTERARADALRKAGQLEEAAREYAALWPDGDPWTGWGYAHCLRKLGRTAEALEVVRAVYRLDPTFRLGRSLYAWTIYDGHVRGATQPEPELLKAADAVVRLTASEEEAYAPTCPLVATVLRVAKAWADRGRDLHALEWLDKLDPVRLDSKALNSTDPTGQPRELASNRERYYSIRTRSLERLGRWGECLDAASRGLADCGRLHHDNEIWFARRIALAKLHLGRAEEALTELLQLTARKPSGFIHTDIAMAGAAVGNVDVVFKHALHALLSPSDIGFTLEAARLLAEVLWGRGEADHARAHVRLCISVRASKGWNPSEELGNLAKSWDVGPAPENPDALLRELRQLWRQWSEDLTPRRSGRVLRMFPHGRAGFIRGSGSEQFYFDVRDWRDRKTRPVEGTDVTFATRPGFDRKYQRATVVAWDVRKAQP